MAPSPASVRSLYRSYLRVAARWPLDPVRPDQPSFGPVLEQSIRWAFRRPVPALQPSSSSGSAPGGLAAEQGGPDTIDGMKSRNVEQEMFDDYKHGLESLQACLRDDFKINSPLTTKITQPVFSPTHYDNLVKGLEAAGRGKTPGSFWDKFIAKSY